MNNLGIYIVAIALLLLADAHSSDPPPLREGLWSVHIVTTANPGNKIKEENYILCRDHASDKQEELAMASLPGCTKSKDTLQDWKRHMTFFCRANGRAWETKSTVSYTGDTATQAVAHTVFLPVTTSSVRVDGVTEMKFVGDCPARLKPGDREQSPALS